MNNFKWGIMAAVMALVISTSLGIVSGVNPVHIFLRSLVFTFVFFGLGTGARILVNVYFPEILYLTETSSQSEGYEKTGSIVNITLGNAGDYAVPEKYKNDPDAQELGNIEALLSGSFRPVSDEGIDRKREEVYNSQGGGQTGFQDSHFGGMPLDGGASETSPFEMQVFTPSFGDDSGDLGGLPDLGSMAMAFGGGGGGSMEGAETAAVTAAETTSHASFNSGGESFLAAPQTFNEADFMSPNKGNKPQPLQGDFDPKELAEGIRTVLSKDK